MQTLHWYFLFFILFFSLSACNEPAGPETSDELQEDEMAYMDPSDPDLQRAFRWREIFSRLNDELPDTITGIKAGTCNLDKNGGLNLYMIDRQYLKNFSKTDGGGFVMMDEQGEDWTWLMDPGFMLTQQFPVIGRDSARVDNTDVNIEAIRAMSAAFGKAESAGYLGLIYTHTRLLPKVKDEQITAGFFEGHLVVYDIESQEVKCSMPLDVQSSQRIGFFYMQEPGASAYEAVLADFKENFAYKVRKAVSKETGIPEDDVHVKMQVTSPQVQGQAEAPADTQRSNEEQQ